VFDMLWRRWTSVKLNRHVLRQVKARLPLCFGRRSCGAAAIARCLPQEASGVACTPGPVLVPGRS
jgi:hypothetical protein